MNEEKYIIELDHPYRKSETEPNSTIYVENVILHADVFLELAFTFERRGAVVLSNRNVIRRVLNKITTIFINREEINRLPRPRAIRIA